MGTPHTTLHLTLRQELESARDIHAACDVLPFRVEHFSRPLACMVNELETLLSGGYYVLC